MLIYVDHTDLSHVMFDYAVNDACESETLMHP